MFSPILLTMKLRFKEVINTSKVVKLLVTDPELKPASYSKAQLLELVSLTINDPERPNVMYVFTAVQSVMKEREISRGRWTFIEKSALLTLKGVGRCCQQTDIS